MPVYAGWWVRLARYTVLVLVGFLLLWAANWMGWIFPSDRQYKARQVNPAEISVPAGYRVEVLASGLNAPSALEITADGAVYIAESGFGGAYAATSGVEGSTPGRIFRLMGDGTLRLVAGGFGAPLSGFAFDSRGTLYASHRGTVTAVSATGERRDVITGLPSLGDHGNNQIGFGPDGKLYVLQGTVTNSGVVGLDNWVLWTRYFPGVRDIPCRDITLRGANYTVADPRSVIPFMRVRTGAFAPLGHLSYSGQEVRGQLPCNGAVMRANPDGTGLELVAWGLRNPFGLGWGPDGALYVTDDGPDERGSRPLGGDDLFHKIMPGAWYGWPDYWNGRPASDPHEGRPGQQMLLYSRPVKEPATAFASLGDHVGVAGFDFAPASFGFGGQAFIAQWGSGFPATTQNPALAGFNVVRLDPATRKPEVFARNRRSGPASLYKDGGGFERPVDIRFGPDGAMYVLDWGHMGVTRKGPYHIPDGGVLWRISRDGAATLPYQYRPPEAGAAAPAVARAGAQAGPGGSAWPDPRPAVAAACLAAAGWLLWRRRRV